MASRDRIVMAGVGLVGGIALLVAVNPAPAESAEVKTDKASILDVMNELPADVKEFNEHLTILASPYMGGRLPGTPGMERAKEYMQLGFEEAGLEPPFGDSGYRDPFELGGTVELQNQLLEATVDGDTTTFTLGDDYEMTGFGGDGSITGDAVFVGYSIQGGPDDYSTFDDDTDLEGKVAIMLRFEPMDDDGQSRWSDNGWSPLAGFNGKLRAVADRNPAAVVIINTPGADDPRIDRLISSASQITDAFPVFMMTGEAGAELIKGADAKGRSIMDLRKMADAGGGVVELNAQVTVGGDLVEEPVIAENVGGLLRGKGDLADEYIVVGAHLDHLGNGDFGSREGPGKLHPGADDNASGSVGVMMLGKSLARAYAELPDDANARSILFVGFSAEESGLNGSRHYVGDPIAPIDQHVLMTNFDMIGRIEGGRLNISGTSTGVGMKEWLQPYADASDLDVQIPERFSGASDHTSFHRAGMPVLFGCLDRIHDDYHTSRDVTEKINRVDATKTVRIFHEIIYAAALRPDRFELVESTGGGRGGGGGFGRLKVRMGIRMDQAAEGINGIMVGSVTEGGSAEVAGIQAGDILLQWNKQEMPDVQAMFKYMSEHEPGDEVTILLMRDGEEHRVKMTLQARGGRRNQ